MISPTQDTVGKRAWTHKFYVPRLCKNLWKTPYKTLPDAFWRRPMGHGDKFFSGDATRSAAFP